MTTYYRDIQSARLRNNLVGKKYGRLLVTEMVYEKMRPTRVKCVCDCGKTIESVATYLTSGETTSCGCYQKEMASKTNTKDFSDIESVYGIKFISRASKNDAGQWLWNCKCSCGNIFVALPAKIQSGHITSCGCLKRSSREAMISEFLSKTGVPFVSEYRFDDCRDVKELPFDFYIPGINVAIEYQGVQHYVPSEFFGGDDAFKLRVKHDDIKRAFCKAKSIRLVELPYTLTDAEIIKELQTLFIRRDCNG